MDDRPEVASLNRGLGGLARLSTAGKATRQETRRNNLRLALQLVYRQAPTSRAEIARATGLTPATASALVDELIARRLVQELGPGETSGVGGKPPILLGPAIEGRNVVSVDLSSHPFRGAVLDLSGRIVDRRSAPAGDLQGSDAVTATRDLIVALKEAATAPVIGVGVGTPGIVDPTSGSVVSSNLGWDGVALAAQLVAPDDLPVHVFNDAQAAAFAEYAIATATEAASSLVVVRIGEGIGAGIILDGHLYRGDMAAAGEIGHLRVVDGGDLCSCGNTGCLETVAALPALLRRINQLASVAAEAVAGAAAGAEASARAGAAAGAEAGVAGAFAAAAARVEAAPVLQHAAGHVGRVLAHVVAVLAVRHLVVSGPIVAAGPAFLDEVDAELRSRVFPGEVPDIRLGYSSLGDDVILLGSAGLVMSEEMGVVW